MSFTHTFTVAGKEYTEPVNRAKAIKMHCKDCCAGRWDEVRACHLNKCPLHPFRLGKDPGRKPKVLSDEQKKVMAARLKTAKESKMAPLLMGGKKRSSLNP